jgi:hypothetical protein
MAAWVRHAASVAKAPAVQTPVQTSDTWNSSSKPVCQRGPRRSLQDRATERSNVVGRTS